MNEVEPQVFLVSEPKLNWKDIISYLEKVNGLSWSDQRLLSKDWDGLTINLDELSNEDDAETLVEFMGKMCYRSWAPGLNPNVKMVRNDQKVYIENILRSKHGSVLEHATFSFVFYGVSRVFTHELVRHRAGVAISQESMRFVRLDDMPFWMPEWAKDDEELQTQLKWLLQHMEDLQTYMAEHFKLDEEGIDFHEKKEKTSFMRRFAPDGVGTSIGWTANIRTLRHVIEARTTEGAEEEIRLVFDKVAQMMVEQHPLFFGDFERNDKGEWIPEWSKV